METLASPTRQCGIENMDADSGDRLAIEETGCPGNVPPQNHSKLGSWYLHLLSLSEPSGHR